MVWATKWFLSNKAQEGVISTKTFEMSHQDDLVSSLTQIVDTPIFGYQILNVMEQNNTIIKYRQLIRSEIIDNFCFVKPGLSLIDKFAWAWGNNTNGNLGNNSISNTSSPISVIGDKKFIQIEMTENSSYGLDLDGYVWSWGDGTNGLLGNSSINASSSPVSVIGGRQFVTIGCSNDCIGAIDISGNVWTWGYNQQGQLGDNTIANKSSPVSIVGDNRFVAIKGNVAIDTQNRVWSWGNNFYGQVGNNNTQNTSSPVLMVGGPGINKNIISLSKSETFALMLSNDGICYAVGNNSFGQLGDGTIEAKSSPISVNIATKIVQIASGSSHVLALDYNGNIWVWGKNNKGQLGISSTTNISVPTMIQDRKFILIGAKNDSSIAIDVDGYLWCFGSGQDGLLGNNDVVDKSKPVSVVGNYRSIFDKLNK